MRRTLGGKQQWAMWLYHLAHLTLKLWVSVDYEKAIIAPRVRMPIPECSMTQGICPIAVWRSLWHLHRPVGESGGLGSERGMKKRYRTLRGVSWMASGPAI